MQLPKKYEERMKECLGEEFTQYKECLEMKSFCGLRVNNLKITTKEFEKISPFPLKKIPWVENGYYYDSELKVARHPYYYAGLYYIQEPSAMTPAAILPIEEGDKVLDLCAAPGGKSTELAAKLNGTGVLVSNDISNSRAKGLLKNIELMGVKNAIVMSEEPNKLSKVFTNYFDKILVDAPCSGEGMFRRDPSMIKSWEKNGPSYYANIQKDILSEAALMLKPGGLLLYSTCTFSVEEDEESILNFLLENKDFEVVKVLAYEKFDSGHPEWINKEISLDLVKELKKCIRIWPHKVNGEGHFITLLHKKGEYATNISDVKNKTKIPEELRKFLKDIDTEFNENQIVNIENRYYYLPKDIISLKGLRVLRSGLLLGEEKKNRFEASQALSLALKKEEYKNNISYSSKSDEVIKYLKGETLLIDYEKDTMSEDTFTNRKGMQLICVEDFPLGFAKLSGSNLKNKYYAGWRWM